MSDGDDSGRWSRDETSDAGLTDYGFRAAITKPFDAMTLSKVVADVIEGSR